HSQPWREAWRALEGPGHREGAGARARRLTDQPRARGSAAGDPAPAAPAAEPYLRTLLRRATPLAQLLAVPLVVVERAVGGLIERLPVHPRLPCGESDADLDALRGAGP